MIPFWTERSSFSIAARALPSRAAVGHGQEVHRGGGEALPQEAVFQQHLLPWTWALLGGPRLALGGAINRMSMYIYIYIYTFVYEHITYIYIQMTHIV